MTTGSPAPRSTPPRRARGALEPRDDRLSVYWTLGVTGLFALVMLFAILGVPSRFIPGPTEVPLPSPASPSFSIPVSPSIEIIPPSVSPSGSPSASPAT